MFTLNAFGVAGFFGGETAVNGMATVIFFFRGRWGGLYNTPGSLEIAKRYGQLASPRLFRGLFPGDTRDPSQLFGLDSKPGPKFLAACSGSLFEKTGHLGYLLARMAKTDGYVPVSTIEEAQDPHQRITTPATVTIVDLTHLDNSKPDKIVHPALPFPHYGFFALVPIVASVGACIGCALVGDWWSFSSIVLGMIANGWACFVLGLGKLTFQHPEPARDAPPGDGILWAADNAVVVIRGTERAVNAITRGHFFLQYGEGTKVPPIVSNTPSPSGEKDRPHDLRLNTPPTPAMEQSPTTAAPDTVADQNVMQDASSPDGSQDNEPLISDVGLPSIPLDAPSPDADVDVASDADVVATENKFLIPTTEAPLSPTVPTTSSPSMADVSHLDATPGSSTASAPQPPASEVTQGVPSTPAEQEGLPAATLDTPPSKDTPPSSTNSPPPSNPSSPTNNPQCIDKKPENRKPNSLFISISSVLLTVQFVAQLLLIPQGSVFGQLMFVGTLAFSWGYNVFISSIDSEDVQTGILCDILDLKEEGGHGGDGVSRKGVWKFEFGTWTAMSVFACLALRPESSCAVSSDPNPASESNPTHGGCNSRSCDSRNLSKVLNALIPNDTADWNQWKEIVGKKLQSQDLVELEVPSGASGLLKSIIGDAQAAYRRYSKAFPSQQ